MHAQRIQSKKRAQPVPRHQQPADHLHHFAPSACTDVPDAACPIRGPPHSFRRAPRGGDSLRSVSDAALDDCNTGDDGDGEASSPGGDEAGPGDAGATIGIADSGARADACRRARAGGVMPRGRRDGVDGSAAGASSSLPAGLRVRLRAQPFRASPHSALGSPASGGCVGRRSFSVAATRAATSSAADCAAARAAPALHSASAHRRRIAAARKAYAVAFASGGRCGTAAVVVSSAIFFVAVSELAELRWRKGIYPPFEGLEL